MYQTFNDENGIDDHDHYGDPDVPRSEGMYRDVDDEVNYCSCGNESLYNKICDECAAKCRQFYGD